MESHASTAKAAAAVTQALEGIKLPSTRRPSVPLPFASGRTQNPAAISSFQKFRPVAFNPLPFNRPWKTTQRRLTSEEMRHHCDTFDLKSSVPIANQEEQAFPYFHKATQQSTPDPGGYIEKQLQQLETNHQLDSEGEFVALGGGAGTPTDNSSRVELKTTGAALMASTLAHQVPTPIVPPHYDALSLPLDRRKQSPQGPPSSPLKAPGLSSYTQPQTFSFQVAEVASSNSDLTTDSSIPLTPDSEDKPTVHDHPFETPTLSAEPAPHVACINRFSEDTATGRRSDPPEPLSRQDDEFDFAILLKASKYEENVDLRETPSPRSRPNFPFHPDFTNERALIISRIRHTGLHVQRLLSLDGKQSLLKVRAPQRVLELGAERLRLRKQRHGDHVWMVFTCRLRTSFAEFDSARACMHFLDSEKQRIVHGLLTAPEREGGAGLNDSCNLAVRYVVQMYPLHKHDLATLETRWVTFWRRTPHAETFEDSRWFLARNILQQPLDDVAQYFGERVAFYFAWMELYTRWLVVPSVAGVLLFVLQVSSHQLDHPVAPLYALFMALWTSYLIIAWRRRAATLAYHWGTWGYEDEEVTRPEFYGDVRPTLHDDSEVDKFSAAERHYALWKRVAKYSVTLPCVAGSIAAVVTLAYCAFSTRDRLEADSLKTKHDAALIADKIKDSRTISLEDLRALATLGVRWDFWVYLLLTPLLYGLLIPVLDAAFTRAARRLNNWENHRTESRYQSHLILKVFAFRFVHVFASLYYYAFAPHAHAMATPSDSDATKSSGMVRVAIQLASFMVTGQLWKNVMETLFPFVRRRLEARAKKRASNDKFKQSTIFNGLHAGPFRRRGTTTKLATEAMRSSNAVIHAQCVRLEQASDRAWEEATLKQYDTFEDYTEMLVQFGYVAFFSLAFPLAPLLALVNNLLELRTDAFKLCHTRQRPLAHKASGIGVWLHVLQIMSVLTVLTNCFHLAYSTSLLERAFPSVPRDVSERLRRERELAKHDSARAMAARLQNE